MNSVNIATTETGQCERGWRGRARPQVGGSLPWFAEFGQDCGPRFFELPQGLFETNRDGDLNEAPSGRRAMFRTELHFTLGV